MLSANSILWKSAELHLLLDYIKADAVLIDESKLDCEISTYEFIPENLGYTVYQTGIDMQRYSSKTSILIKSAESLRWIQVQFKNQQKLLISKFYRPPSNDNECLKLCDASLLDINIHTTNNPNHTIIISGDLNFLDINWEHNCVSASSNETKLHDIVLSIPADHNLNQVVTEPMREDSILDLMVMNNPSIIKSMRVIQSNPVISRAVNSRKSVSRACTLDPKF